MNPRPGKVTEKKLDKVNKLLSPILLCTFVITFIFFTTKSKAAIKLFDVYFYNDIISLTHFVKMFYPISSLPLY